MEGGRIRGLSIEMGLAAGDISRSMSEIKRSIRGLNSEAKVTSNNFKFGEKSTKSYKEAIDQLSTTTEKQRKNVEELGKRYTKIVEEQGASSKAAQNAATEYNKQADNLNRLESQLSSMESELAQLSEEQRIAESRWTKMGEAAEKAGDKMQGVGRGMKDIGKKAVLGITTPLLAFGGLATKTGMDFDDAMSKVAAISGATGDDLENLRAKAKEMGATTKFSASEAAEGLNYMALAGWDTEEMLGGLDGVMSLAAASGEDLGSVSDIVTDALSAFGLEAKDSGQFADVLAAASANANTDVTGLGNAFKYVAPVAGALNFTVEDTAKAIGLMSDNGIKGEKAGTALRTMMTNLAKPTKAMQEEMDNLGISLTDTDGNMKTFDEIMNDLRSSFSGLTEEQQASAAATIFGKESMSGALAIINTTEESFDDLGNAINNSEGAAETMAATMEDNLGGTWREIKSGIEGFSISVYETMLPTLEKMSDKIREGIQWLNNLSPKAKTLGVVFAGIAAAIGPLLVAGGSLLMFVGGVVKSLAPVMTSIAKAGGLIKWLTPLFGKLGVAFSVLTGPIGLTIAAITALGAGFVLAYNKSETFRGFIDGIGEKISGAVGWLTSFKDGILGLFKDDGMEGIDILTSIGLSQELADSLWGFTGYFIEFKNNVSEQIENVKTTIGGIFEIFKGNHVGAAEMLSSVGLSEETIDGIFQGVGKIKGIYNNMKDDISLAFSTVGSYFKQHFGGMLNWWNENGPPFIDAVITLFGNIKNTLTGFFGSSSGDFNAFATLISGLWSHLWNTISAVVQGAWSQIKMFIEIGTSIGQGLIQMFTAAVNGNWTEFWSILRNTAGSVKDAILGHLGNLKEIGINLFHQLFGGAIQWFGNMRTNLTEKALGLKNSITSRFTELKDSAINRISGMYNSVTSWFGNLYSNTTQKAANIKNSVVSRFNELKDGAINRVVGLYNSVTSWFSSIFTGVTNKARALKNDTVSLFVSMKDGAIDGVQKLYNGATTLFDDVKQYATDTFTNMVDGAKELPGKLGSAISNGASKAVDGVKSLGNKMTGKLGSVVNGVIGGLNSITSKIGIDTTISEWSVPTFSTGTGQGSPSGKLTKNGKIAMDTLATVGDKGKGNGKGTRELVHYPNGKVGLYDNDATIFAPKGTTIFSNQETESLLNQIPRFSEGTGLFGKIKEIAGKAIDYITNPKKIFDDLVSAVGERFDGMGGFALDFIKGAWNRIKDGMFEWIKGKFSEASVGKSQKWMDYKMTTPYSPNAPVPGYPTSFNKGHHYGIDYGTPVGVNITAPMAGTVTKINDRGGGNVARLKAGGNAAQYFMHMSSVKTGKVGIGQSVGRSGNSGEFTTGAHVHWQHEDPSASYVQNRFTKNPLDTIKGHLKGGQILSDGLFNLHKGEYVINPNEPTEAMKLLAIVGKKLAGKSKQTREISSVPGTTGNEELLDKMQQQIDLLTQLVVSSRNIEAKELKVGDNQIGQANSRFDARQNARNQVTSGRFNYNV